VIGQLKAMQLDQHQEILSDEMLEVVTHMETLSLNEAEHLSLNALKGTDNDSTIRLPATVNDLKMLMLVDSGSTTSFVDCGMVAKLGLIPQPTSPVYVKVANGAKMLCNSIIPQFTWCTQGIQFSHDMLVLDMGGYDAVLGMDWLKKFRPMNCDWVAKWLEFSYQEQTVKLQGVLDVRQDHLTEISLDQVIQWHKNNELWATAVLETNSDIAVLPIPEEVQQLLQQFASVFQEPNELPPTRAFDHAISLLPGTSPPNTRPYRYSPLQKDEIERQVTEMLKSGVIT
jgi:hypothetical protein